jgi:hypothetical protein
MAMYENLAAGVALVVPSKTFYTSIARQLRANGVDLHLDDLPVLERHPDGWDAMEWFNPYFKDALIRFDSWDHLREMLAGSNTFLEHKARVRKFMRRHTSDVVKQWDSILWCAHRCN